MKAPDPLSSYYVIGESRTNADNAITRIFGSFYVAFEVYAATEDPGQAHLLERIESRNGILTVEASAALGFGSREYELIQVE